MSATCVMEGIGELTGGPGSAPPPPPGWVADALSPHSAVMAEVGKALLLDSLETGKEFCKSMIGIANGAIPIYLGLLSFVAPEKYRPSPWEAVAALIPPTLFLLASIAFADGYFPRVHLFNIDVPNEVNDVHSTTVYRRRRSAWLGFILFCAGLVGAVALTLLASNRLSGGPH
jgi:hypothetical protein